MSRQVEQHTLLQDNAHEGANDSSAMDAMNALNSQNHEAKPEIILNETDVRFVIKHCSISRSEAIDLMTKANGDVKETLRLYVQL